MASDASDASPADAGAAAAPASPLLAALLADNAAAAKTFDTPLSLGARKKLSIVTCMDSRLLVDRMFPTMGLGDVEIIRNAGGRVTPDVLRSLFIAQEVPELGTRAVLIIHHTDCGAQAAIRHHQHLTRRMRELAADWAFPVGWALQAGTALIGGLLPRVLRRALLGALMRPFEDPAAALRTDVALLRASPLMPRGVEVHGAVYDVRTGRLAHVLSA